VYLPIVTWLTGFHSRALCFPALHPWRDPCRRVSGDGMRVEPSLMHPEGGSWTEVRTHTPSKLSKVQRTFVPHPLGILQVSGERITAPSEPDVPISRHPALHPRVSSVALAGDCRNCPQCLTCSCRQHSRVLTVEYLWPLGLSPFPSAWGFRLCYHSLYLGRSSTCWLLHPLQVNVGYYGDSVTIQVSALKQNTSLGNPAFQHE
jgi:hypothetical protein